MRKKALITGASRGIGAATARALGQAGYDLFLVCKSSEKELHIIKEEIEKSSGVSCEAALCDVSDPKQVEAMVQKAGEVHILVNNAAISHVGLMTDMSLSDWHRVIDTNLSAVFYLCRLIVPQMVRRQSGKILNVSSVWGNAGASMETAYSASKGGVNSFTKALAKELAAQMGRASMSSQAVGGAVGHNPISIIIPCHRVMGADGSLTGYAGGVEKKKKLLEIERQENQVWYLG